MDTAKELALKCPRSHPLAHVRATEIYTCAECKAEWTETYINHLPWCEKDEQPCFPFGVSTHNVAQAFVCPVCTLPRRLLVPPSTPDQ